MGFTAYLTFDGDCEKAFEFYKAAFGGEIVVKQRFSDGPPEMAAVAKGEERRIMHMTLAVGDSVLQGSDAARGHADAVVKGNNFTIVWSPPSREEADAVFAKLKEGGKLRMPMQETFWGSYFGMCTDKFGIQWMINMDIRKN